jgi:hypothetical protein
MIPPRVISPKQQQQQEDDEPSPNRRRRGGGRSNPIGRVHQSRHHPIHLKIRYGWTLTRFAIC